MFAMDHVHTRADMLSKWCHHVRQQRASVLFTQRNRFMKTTRAVWSVRDGKGLICKSGFIDLIIMKIILDRHNTYLN